MEKKPYQIITKDNPKLLLDIATGTGDLAIMASKYLPNTKIVGIDLSNGMLEIGRKKIEERKLTERIEMIQADSENLPFDDNTFDNIMVAFGVRNFENLLNGLKEANRVLKQGGSIYILEFSRPKNALFRVVFNFYFKNLLPFIGKITSKDKNAYKYLFESVQAFPSYDDFIKIMENASFVSNNYHIQTLGICSIYHGKKS
ncbi:MAG: ubiquinone/menaquinone biosynthesis methyltransferase [Saprospiraceae bacterium]